jgi:hypothetical protein
MPIRVYQDFLSPIGRTAVWGLLITILSICLPVTSQAAGHLLLFYSGNVNSEIEGCG